MGMIKGLQKYKLHSVANLFKQQRGHEREERRRSHIFPTQFH